MDIVMDRRTFSSIDFERREEIVDRIECFESIDKSNPRSLRPHFSPRKDENLYIHCCRI